MKTKVRFFQYNTQNKDKQLIAFFFLIQLTKALRTREKMVRKKTKERMRSVVVFKSYILFFNLNALLFYRLDLMPSTKTI